jgi:arylsulfatase A-like enzyme
MPPQKSPAASCLIVRSTLIALAAVGLMASAFGETGIPQRPNIFFAIADDWGWPHAEAYGDPVVKTPTFERIARNGLLFNNAFVSSPSCTPSRNAVLTGQYHWRLGPGANLWSDLPAVHQTFTHILEANGYHVGTHRKAWGPGQDRDPPAAGTKYDGFQEFLDRRPDGQPFFFWAGSSDPHRPYRWRSGVESGMNPDQVVVPPVFPDTEAVRTDICDYYFEVQRFDREIGEQLRILEEIGELDNTIIVMTGDHGWPFPRGKSNLYDLGTHVPLAIQWTEQCRPNRIVHDFVSLTDLAPTFLEAAGLSPLPAMTGRSLIPLIESLGSGWIDPDRDYVLTGKERHTPAQAESMAGTPMRAIRTSSHLYIHNFEPDRWPAGGPTSIRGPAWSDIDNSPTKTAVVAARNDPETRRFFELSCGKRPTDELYELETDPYQMNNVADDPKYARILASLKERLFRDLEATGDPRATGSGETFDQYPYYGKIANPPDPEN